MEHVTVFGVTAQTFRNHFLKENAACPRSFPREAIHYAEEVCFVPENPTTKWAHIQMKLSIACSESEWSINDLYVNDIFWLEELTLVKRAIIEIVLVPEASERLPDEIEREILTELCEGFLRIPWSYEIGRVKVIET